MVIRPESSDSIKNKNLYKDGVLAATRKFYENDTTAYVVELIHDSTIALIVNMNNKSLMKDAQDIMTRTIKNIVEEQLNGRFVIGIGKAYDSIDMISRSFIEALAALENNNIKSGDDIIFFEDIDKLEKQIYWYPVAEQLQYLQSLKQGDGEQALEVLNVLFINIMEKNATNLMVKYICFDLINGIVKFVNEMNIDDYEHDIEKLMEFNTLKELKERIQLLTIKLCDYIEERKRSKDVELYKLVLISINTKLQDSNLSLDSLANEYSVPAYYLSRLFKELMGSTFTEYISKLRMDKAKEMLIKTEKPIKDIYLYIGYTDPTSFMRRFKQLEGISPGQYRKLYQQNK